MDDSTNPAVPPAIRCCIGFFFFGGGGCFETLLFVVSFVLVELILLHVIFQISR